ncbi:MAG: sulfatase, partial [Pirellulaceae bacterium]
MRKLLVLFLLTTCFVPAVAAADAKSPPNVLFISVDDLNDWVNLYGGHSQALTPNIDALAAKGAVVFQNAHCPGPVCGPSRSALLSGFMPHRSGVYGNSQNMLRSPLVQQHATMPEYFAKQDYQTISRGKIFHAHATANGQDKGQWAFESWHRGEGGNGVDRKRVTSRDKNLINGQPGAASKFTQGGGSEFAWGPTRGAIEETGDHKTAVWAAEQLSLQHDKPFFLAVGLSKPHLPFYAPQSFYDLYPIDKVKANPILADDLDDILTPSGKPKFKPSEDFLWLQENELLEEVTQAYLACVSYADACVGEIIRGLEDGPNANNTIVVLWGDHGWHLGEKLRYRKATGWIEATRLPLLIRTPAMTERRDCDRPVNLIDLFPTLIDYCGLPAKTEIDGKSLVPLLEDPTAKWDAATVTVFGQNNASVIGQRWHYISHSDGTRELYDLEEDPLEWNNLANNPTVLAKAARDRLAEFVPKQFADPI